MLCVVAQGATLSIVSPQPADISTCAYVIASPMEMANASLLALFQWDAQAFGLGMTGAFTMFGIGAGVGLVINLLRKLKS